MEAELDKLELMLASTISDDAGRTRIASRLQTLLAGLDDSAVGGEIDTADDTDLESATDDEMFDLIDRELGELRNA